ncbi:fasciclin domain-containing protein [Pelobium manganitolerans]|uniref:fasciclin domain-containing protein n=1 Tax=Pelobium manganitolerans TaxID=1842495 RepID=UPI003FA3CBD1
MNCIKRNFAIATLILAGMFSSCKDAWQDHNELKLQTLDKTIATQISEDADLSVFNSYLVKTGYDKILAGSKTYTVWAPTNTALANLDASVVNDEEKLKAFVSNHIANQAYFTQQANKPLTLRALSGKNVIFTATSFEDANLVKTELSLKNGALHIVDGTALPKPNAWEFLQANSNTQKQASYIASLDFTEIDTTQGVPLFKDPITGQTVFQEGTTFPVTRNRYFRQVADLSSEDSTVTVIILNDNAFDTEVNKLKPYYQGLSADSTEADAKFSAVKDLVIRGRFDLANLPDSLRAVTGVQVHLDKSAVVETKQLSNGVAYVVNAIGYKVLENKIPTVIIQGELTDSIRSQSAVVYKKQKSPDGFLFDEIQSTSITSSPSPLYHYRYKTTVNSVKYAVYWRSINDILTTPFSMAVKFSVGKKLNDTLLGTDYKEVPPFDPSIPETYRETYLGEYTAERYGTLYSFLIQSTGATSTAPTALSLDYIKLVPIN